MTVHMVHHAMHKARVDVASASDRLAAERTRADCRVSGFLGSGWTGVAAESFVDAWDDWLVAAAQVRDGLEAMHQLLGAVHRDLTDRDEAAHAALDRISRRIVERLG